jgi:hypothetical protein
MKIYHFEDGTEVPWEMNRFPDGQLQIKIKKDDLKLQDLKVVASLFNPSAVDLFFQCLDTFDVYDVRVNYLYGARSDKNESGDYWVANVAKDLTRTFEMYWQDADMNFEFLAPHCHEFCKGIGKVNFDLPDCVNLDDYDLLIFPDESARTRYANVNKPGITCEKHRDQETSKILSHVIPNLPSHVKKVLVLDDLCDGGATFINVADVLPEGVKADLFVFHGVFSNAAPIRLFTKYDNIIVSNSLPHVQEMANIFDQWKNKKIGYKTATECLGVEHFTQYKDFVPGNLVVFDVWGYE